MVEEGSWPDVIDNWMEKEFGFAAGTFKVVDLSGKALLDYMYFYVPCLPQLNVIVHIY